MNSKGKDSLSIICPAFNEEDGIEENIARLRDWIDRQDRSVEVLLIDDGSKDRTVALAQRAIGADERFRIISHLRNFGRGRALRTGFREAQGKLIITCEADLSWGTATLERMLEALDGDVGIDAVFASTHLSTGGYRNVPAHRVFLSSMGNRILRFLYSGEVTMTTGMTRAYRASVIQAHSFSQDGKEIHLEIAHRLLSLGNRVAEVPAVLSWPDSPQAGNRGKRTNWTKIFRLVNSHLAFGVFQGISRIIGPLILALTVLIGVLGVWAVSRFVTGDTSIFLVMLVGVMSILWVNLTLGYFLLFHIRQVEVESWKTQSLLCRYFNAQGHEADSAAYYVCREHGKDGNTSVAA
jgi:glycosyltransferase involved in cell wall biosynthesis